MAAMQTSQPTLDSIAPRFAVGDLEISSPLVAKPWGLKEFSIHDPFRNLILFAEGIPEEESSAEQEE